MAHLIRGRQIGIQNDLSAGLSQEQFVIDEISRYGINSQISAMAYDPVQSLLAVGTRETRFGTGQIYVFGHKRVSVVLSLQRKTSIQALQFCADKLICLDARHDLSVFSLETKRLLFSHTPPGTALTLCTDPTLDYALLGMQTGDVLAYDLDRGAMAPFKLPSFWAEMNPRARMTPVVSLALHPRDIGTLLIGYAEGAVIYSFKQNKAVKFFQYEVPRGAPGGDIDPASTNVVRHPRLSHAAWHPTGTFILTGHEDGSLVFWDPKDGRIVMARTFESTNINKPQASSYNPGRSSAPMGVKEPLFRIAWCANQDPDDTAILIAGGASSTSPAKGLTLFELGRTPNYATSSWQLLFQHFESPKRQRILPTPPGTEVVDFCLIPRSTPYFAGAHDPVAILALLGSGEMVSMSFPSGFPISPTNQLHISLTLVHPFITSFNLSPAERPKWLGMKEERTHGPLILQGGAETPRAMKRFEHRNVVQTCHADGTIRLWDAGHADEIENELLVQADVARAVGRLEGIDITKVSFSGASGELAAGTRSGEMVVFRWSKNTAVGMEPTPGPNVPRNLTNVLDRTDPALVEGLLPFTLLDMKNGPVTALQLSDVGFVAAGFEGGDIAVVDLRGPALIYNVNLQELKNDKRGSFHRSSQPAERKEYPTAVEFSVMALEGENYSSILLHIGTSLGRIATFKLLPGAGGRYSVQFAGAIQAEDTVIRIIPLSADTGAPAYASQHAVSSLRNGYKVNGVLLAVTRIEARIFKPASNKGVHKSWDEFACCSAMVTRCHDAGYALVALFADGAARAFSIPGLKEIAATKVGGILDPKRLGEAVVTATGDILGWTGPSEIELINIWGSGAPFNPAKDTLFNPEIAIPPRPTISNLQWISGTQYVTAADMDLLIGGPDRPPSKRMLEQMRNTEAATRAGGGAAGVGAAAAAGQNEGYWAYMQRQINERTERLNIMGDSVDRLEQASTNWADDVSKYVQKQKKNAIMGVVKGRFGM
ncbi:snare-dependent exocytosis protein [Trichodelitschia bisporula]|uniref:Snare-dependent exocytosis protein n=1 Tax=Trichodelitschia bisporula TaxID=703511 RepID=A0A6G1HUV9_9PEZI|nr:snare-dependent exocytosis protein [Trichodelitschia bisporula]